MSDYESFEAELGRLKPAKPPGEFTARLKTAVAPASASPEGRAGHPGWHPGWLSLLRWGLAAGSAVILVTLMLHYETGLRRKPLTTAQGAKSGSSADSVNIEHQLVADFDTVAQAPGGAPVRFRCREWVDQVVLRDPERGVVIERRQPRLEVIPVSFETY